MIITLKKHKLGVMMHTVMPMFGKKMWKDHELKSLWGNVANSLSQTKQN